MKRTQKFPEPVQMARYFFPNIILSYSILYYTIPLPTLHYNMYSTSTNTSNHWVLRSYGKWRWVVDASQRFHGIQPSSRRVEGCEKKTGTLHSYYQLEWGKY